jgi:hypothetical protein
MLLEIAGMQLGKKRSDRNEQSKHIIAKLSAKIT